MTEESKKDKILRFLRSVLSIGSESQGFIARIGEHATLERYAKGEYIFFEGDRIDRGYYVFEGRVSLRKSSSNGKDLIVALLPTGEPFGTLAALDGRPFPLSAQAQSDCLILEFPVGEFRALMAENPRVGNQLMGAIGARLRNSHELSRALAHDKVEVRVAATLLSLRPSCAPVDPDELLLSRQELADAAGITIETATRVMKRLELEGAVDLTGTGRVRLLRIERIKAIVEESQ
ncbi:MAG: Crp/Fnr family transcriptional regulator [Bdellovibrionales bacterium]|nr:Crp/Fnr family transcriptional regulator [Bdellovibrionales bacterium]